MRSLALQCAIYRVPAKQYLASRDELIDLLDLSPLLDTPVRLLSLGQRMRCDLAAALIHSPSLVFLDEPTIGLDAVSKLAVRKFVRRLNRERGVTVINAALWRRSMSAIAGIIKGDGWEPVKAALGLMHYRGGKGNVIVDREGVILSETHNGGLRMWLGRTGDCRAVCAGMICNWRDLAPEALDVDQALEMLYDSQGPDFVRDLDGSFALAIASGDESFIARDPLGIAPLYYGECEGRLCFASEVKAPLAMKGDVHEFPPGYCYRPVDGAAKFFELPSLRPAEPSRSEAADEVRARLADAVSKSVDISTSIGCWLSGGLDSSTIAALARPHVTGLKTFSVGVEGSPDLDHARAVARYIDSTHHELCVGADDLLTALPDVVYHPESFDSLLVRSSLTNYQLAKLSSDHVSTVLSGEGGDELFAGYDHLGNVEPNRLDAKLRCITSALHNTALQRVDRSAAAHGMTAHVPFLDRRVVSYAFSLPDDYKLHRNAEVTGKGILRRAASPLLPSIVIDRPKSKFWEGAGVSRLIWDLAEQSISDADFHEERRIPGAAPLVSKEELFYYRIFREHFGGIDDYSFVGRTKAVT